MTRKITLVPGDGIGPEITQAVKTIFAAAHAQIEWEEIDVGLQSYELSGNLIPETFITSIKTNKVALKGPTTTPVGGGHRSINVTIRQQFDLYANIRPLKSLPGVPSKFDNIDIIIVRENSEDLYKGIEYKVSEGVAQGIKLITSAASERIGHHAFKLARKMQRKKVTVVHKANIMKYTDGLFLESIRRISSQYSDIELTEMIIDNCCMQLVLRPEQFDVIVTENLYGDILSDLVAGLVGGLGFAAGSNIGETNAIFEAAHGSAPDIANKGIANPTAMLLSGCMLLDHIDQDIVAQRVRKALFQTLKDPNSRTKDINGTLGTAEFAEQIVKNL